MGRFSTVVAENRRLNILELLADAPEYEASQMLLYQALLLPGSLDQVAADLAWLDEQGLVTLHTVEGIRLAKISMRGLDCARGRSTCPGVARPLPGE